MNQQIFTYEQENEFESLTVLDIDGEPWFVAAEVCNLLDIKNPTDALLALDEDDKLTSVIPRAGQNRKVNLINESGLYNIIFRSQKPSAKRFKRWVTKEVLPAIRKKGHYGVDRSTLPDFIKRFQLNWAKPDKGYFSVISYLYITLYANLEKEGYQIPDKGQHEKFMRPDVSVGLLFSKYLQKNYPEFADDHKPCEHTFDNGFKVDCRQYKIDLLPIYISFVEDVWIPEHAERYFKGRDRKALDYLPKLIASSSQSNSKVNFALATKTIANAGKPKSDS